MSKPHRGHRNFICWDSRSFSGVVHHPKIKIAIGVKVERLLGRTSRWGAQPLQNEKQMAVHPSYGFYLDRLFWYVLGDKIHG